LVVACRAFDSLVVDVADPEQLVLRLSEQLHEKDMKLTDVRLEALSSAHQLEQLRETLNRMKVNDRGFVRSPICE
jgi:neuron navigator 2